MSPSREQLRYIVRLHFQASNNVAKYEALINGLRIVVELGVRRLDGRGDCWLIVWQEMKELECCDPKMAAYCWEVQWLEERFDGLELNNIPRRDNETSDALAKTALGQTIVPLGIFETNLFKPVFRYDESHQKGRQLAGANPPTLEPVAIVE
jgi:ribonuclease HI